MINVDVIDTSMEIRIIQQKTKQGKTRKYMQLVQAAYRPGKSPTKTIIAHLGIYDPLLYNNLKSALQCSRKNIDLGDSLTERKPIRISILKNLLYLPIVVLSWMIHHWGLDEILNQVIPPAPRAASFSKLIQALILHRCIDPGSKLSFQQWIKSTAIDLILDTSLASMNNTRVHRAMSEMASVDTAIQAAVFQRIVDSRSPRILYLDLTDTWFESGGGSLARRGQTKSGHRSKLKIHIALMVNEEGLPMKWELLPGAISETTVLPSWTAYISGQEALSQSVLIFDRGMTSSKNIIELLDEDRGHLFLTSVKSDSISTFVELNTRALDRLQATGLHASSDQIDRSCQALSLSHYKDQTYARDMDRVMFETKQTVSHRLRMYLYFNREIQVTQQSNRREKIRKVLAFAKELNRELAAARQPRKEVPTLRKICQVIERFAFSEILKVHLRPIKIQGKKKKIDSFQIELQFDRKMYRLKRRYDGITLLMGHPELSLNLQESIEAYRYKNAVEADFKTIKSVLKIQPTFHWTTEKIQSHVSLCVLALLIERLLEQKLDERKSSCPELPLTAHALLRELDSVRAEYVLVEKSQSLIRSTANERIRFLLSELGLAHLLDQLPEAIDHRTTP